jgi:serine protease inhibitor
VTIAIAIWEFHNISRLMENHVETTKDYFPEYRKIDFKDYNNNTKAVNNGWKL